MPALLTFALDAWLQRRQRATMSSRSEAYVPRPDWRRDGINLLAVALIAAAILFQFGSGPIKGFAVTLMIGIVTSMFTAIMLTRLLVVAWIRKTKPTEVPI